MPIEEENQRLREQVAQRDERIQHLEAALEQQSSLMQQMQTHIGSLTVAGASVARATGQRQSQQQSAAFF